MCRFGTKGSAVVTDITDVPRVGFLCFGRDSYSLSVSVRTANKLARIFGECGFANGACYTEISTEADLINYARAESLLSHICSCCEIALTVGGNGFSVCDIMPDITEKICRKAPELFSALLLPRGKAGIFANTLVLNLPNDLGHARKIIDNLMPAIHFAVYSLSGKSPASAVRFTNFLNSSLDFHEVFKKECIINR